MSNEISLDESTKSTQSSTKGKLLKKSHYRDLFNLYFFGIFTRKLNFLYRSYINEDVYILSNLPPFKLLNDNHDASFAFVDLSKADPVFKELVKTWLGGAFPGLEVCIRLDYFVQITNKYFGDKIIPGQELLPVKKEMPLGAYPELVSGFDGDEEYVYYQYSKTGKIEDRVTVAWDTSQGYATIPITRIYKDFKIYLNDNRTTRIEVDKSFPKEEESIIKDNQLYKFKPVVGTDVLSLDKSPAEHSYLLVYPVSNRAISYCHSVTSDGVTVMITRPNGVLFPNIYLKESLENGEP